MVFFCLPINLQIFKRSSSILPVKKSDDDDDDDDDDGDDHDHGSKPTFLVSCD